MTCRRFALLVAPGCLCLLLVAIPGSVGAVCVGDCNGDGSVTVDELMTGVNIALGRAAVGGCPPMDADGSGVCEINELILGVTNALGGCPATPTVSPTTTRTPTATEAPIIEVDCTSGSPACPMLDIAGDGPHEVPGAGPAPWRGFADPSIRRDPESGRLWMTYSWPNTAVVSSGQPGSPYLVGVVDIHLASSNDDGRTWRFEQVLWTARREQDPGGSNDDGYSSHEVATIIPRRTETGVVWYAAHLQYFLRIADDTLRDLRADSFHFSVTRADSPPELGEADDVRLGGVLTADGWGASVNLSSLAPELSNCHLWNEPSLFVEASTLYLAAVCLVWDTEYHPDLGRVIVFATEPEGNPETWIWRHVGRLAGHEEAVELGGENLLQVDLARSRGGELLAVLSPNHFDEQWDSEIHHGCWMVGMQSLDPPTLARGEDGSLEVRAIVTASDLDVYGPGACGYEPGSATGVLFTRRLFSLEEMVWTIHETGIHP